MHTPKPDIFSSNQERKALSRKKDLAKKVSLPKKEYGDIKEKFPKDSFKK